MSKNSSAAPSSHKVIGLEDTILGNYLLSAATQYDCQKGVNGDSPTEPTLRDFANVNAALDTANAFKFLSGKQGEDRFGTAPIRAAYFVLAHTLLESSFDVLNGFIHAYLEICACKTFDNLQEHLKAA